ncbi:MAG TPA: hypothetical protein ENN22_10605 [bacterium]|nr:hypothetical protein [bacterium]
MYLFKLFQKILSSDLYSAFFALLCIVIYFLARRTPHLVMYIVRGGAVLTLDALLLFKGLRIIKGLALAVYLFIDNRAPYSIKIILNQSPEYTMGFISGCFSTLIFGLAIYLTFYEILTWTYFRTLEVRNYR